MRELISIAAGQAGSSIGTAFWQTMTEEHAINNDGHLLETATPEQKRHLDVVFSEADGNRYVPRAIFVDLEPGTAVVQRRDSLFN